MFSEHLVPQWIGMGPRSAKTSELRQIRSALGLSQAEMMDLLALDKQAQNTLSGYETNPKKKGYAEALARAKEVYEARTGEKWKTPGATDEREIGRLEGRIEALERTVQRLSEGYQAHILKEPGKAHPQELSR